MKRFDEYLTETLAAEVKSEPKTKAAKEARRMGLTYMGFGRYADNKGKLAYVVDNDRLVPFKGQEEINKAYSKIQSVPQQKQPAGTKKKDSTGKQPVDKVAAAKQELNSYMKVTQKRYSEDNKILKQKMKEANEVDKALRNFYKPNLFDENEMNAIKDYTADGYEYINSYLYKGHDEGTSQEQHQIINQTIDALDSAFEETEAPFSYTVYSGLSSRYNPEKLKSGGEYIFRGYVSSSVDYNVAIGSFASSEEKSDASVVLQIEISKGQKSIYVEPFSSNKGEKETLLPRGSRIKIVSGPHIVDSSVLSDQDKSSIALFQCKLIEDI